MKNNEVTAKGAIEALNEAGKNLSEDMAKAVYDVEDCTDNLESEVLRLEKRNERLLKAVSEEREKIASYEQLAKVHSAYISILLKKLGATEDNKVEIKATEVTEALNKYESRAIATDEGFALYYTE